MKKERKKKTNKQIAVLNFRTEQEDPIALHRPANVKLAMTLEFFV